MSNKLFYLFIFFTDKSKKVHTCCSCSGVESNSGMKSHCVSGKAICCAAFFLYPSACLHFCEKVI